MNEQRSVEWHMERLGRATASRMHDIVAKTRTGYGASRANYMAQLIAERLTQTIAPSYVNAEMQWGTDHEDEARAAYEFIQDVDVMQVGFIPHPKIQKAGASPDGLIGEEGLVEIKCPNTATHIETLIAREIPSRALPQMWWQMACTGRDWCDFVSYDPRMPLHMQLFIRRLERDGKKIGELEREVETFLAELDGKLAQLTELYPLRAAA